MTPSRTPFAGFERLGAGDPLSSDGYALQDQNPLIADLLAQIGAVLHKHDAHAAMADPTLAATLSVAATGGTLRSAQTIYVQYTLLDGQGGESLPRAVQNVSTPAGYSDPSGAPTAVVSTSAGSMLASTPLYAVSVTDGLGGETALGPSVSVTVPAAAHAEVLLSGLSAITNTASGSDTAAGWRLWRSMDGGNDWDLMATGPHSTDTFTDDGTTAGDCSVSPLAVGTTGSRGVLSVTVPGGQPAPATFFRIYASTDGAFISPCLLGTYPVADLGSAKTYGALSVLAGSPPKVSRSYPGANQIDPTTDLLTTSAAATGKVLTATSSSTASWVTPSGGGGGGNVQVLRFEFTHSTAGLHTGVSLYTPSVGDVLLDAWFQIDTAWNGTTPLADFGFFAGAVPGFFAYAQGSVDMTLAWLGAGAGHPYSDYTVSSGQATSLEQADVVGMATVALALDAIPPTSRQLQVVHGGGGGIFGSGAYAPLDDHRMARGMFAVAAPLKVCVSQTGDITGADPGATQGAGSLYLLVATPTVTVL